MPEVISGTHFDPMFPDYVYTAKALVKVFKNRTGNSGNANLFLGEWAKILDKNISPSGRIYVRYRGGNGYIEPADLTRDRHLEIFFIAVSVRAH